MERSSDYHSGAAVHEVDNADVLYLIAGAHAVAAENALVVVDGYAGGAVVNVGLGSRIRKPHSLNVKPPCYVLELALFVVVAGGAVAAVVRKQKLEYNLAVLSQALGVGAYLHAGFWRGRAGSVKGPPLILDHAHAACTVC